MDKPEVDRLHDEIEQLRVENARFLDRNTSLRAENERLRATLTLIAGHGGQTIFSQEPEYRSGVAHAFNTLADIARAALAPAEGSGE